MIGGRVCASRPSGLAGASSARGLSRVRSAGGCDRTAEEGEPRHGDAQPLRRVAAALREALRRRQQLRGPFVRSAAAFTPLRRGVVSLRCRRGSRPSLRSLAHIWRWSRSALSWPSRRCGLPVLWRYGGRRAAASGHCAAALHKSALHGSARKLCCAALRGCAVYSVMRVCACAGRVCCSRDILCAPGDGAALTRTGARDLVRGLAVARLLLPRPAQGTCPTRRHREACWRAGACPRLPIDVTWHDVGQRGSPAVIECLRCARRRLNCSSSFTWTRVRQTRTWSAPPPRTSSHGAHGRSHPS